MPPPLVIKVGGSLFGLPDLGPRLRRWLPTLARADLLLVPGGGAAADVVRDLDRRHGLGEERAHWLALRALTLTAHFLADLLPGARVVADPRETAGLAVLDAYAFARADDALPHSWAVTSDSVAARAAAVARADRLILLKSVSPAPFLPGAGADWAEAARLGLVDPTFPALVRHAGLHVDMLNCRAG
jgi:aspartokinase-like uncharacterized kinase